MFSESCKKEDLDFTGKLFGLVLGEGEQVGLYIEDDESWYFKCSFHNFWLKDLQSTITRFRQKFG